MNLRYILGYDRRIGFPGDANMSIELITSLRRKLGLEMEHLESPSKNVLDNVWDMLSSELNREKGAQTISMTHEKISKILLDYWLYQATEALKVPQPQEVVEGVDLSSQVETQVDVFGDIEDEKNMRVVKIQHNSPNEMSEVYISFFVNDESDLEPDFSTSVYLSPFPTTIKSEFSVGEEDKWDLKYEVTFFGAMINKITKTRNFDYMDGYRSLKKTEIMDFGTLQFPIETVLA